MVDSTILTKSTVFCLRNLAASIVDDTVSDLLDGVGALLDWTLANGRNIFGWGVLYKCDGQGNKSLKD